MLRSSTLALVVAILPSFASAQQPAQEMSRAHVIVRGETLWGLAQRYYGDAFLWPRIWEANRPLILDPDLILPEWEIQIPGISGPTIVGGVTVAGEDASAVGNAAGGAVSGQIGGQRDAGAFGEGDEGATGGDSQRNLRTVFYRDLFADSDVGGATRREFSVVSRDMVYSAPWLAPVSEGPDSIGAVSELIESGDLRTAFPFSRLKIRLTGLTDVELGDRLITYRSVSSIPRVGQVVQPTGALTVVRLEDGGVVAVVVKAYDRIRAGDLVGMAPAYDLEVGEYPELVTGAETTATLIGFAARHMVPGVGTFTFIDHGEADGAAIGDEYVLLTPAGDGWERDISGRIQIVAVGARTATARVLQTDGAVFAAGETVRLDKKMR